MHNFICLAIDTALCNMIGLTCKGKTLKALAKNNMSYALENIKRYKSRVRREKVAVILYHTLEALTALAIFAFGYLWYSIAI